MLRLESDTGWWLITHQEHAHLAGAFAEHWGNNAFRRPEPRAQVLLAINAHDDGWAMRDNAPSITRDGKPKAISTELVGKYAAHEEIDLADHLADRLAVRGRDVSLMAEREPYAALLISMHACGVLADHADRSKIAPAHLPLLDNFLAGQHALQKHLLIQVRSDSHFSSEMTSDQTIRENFHLLQACDNLSLMACVEYRKPATLLHALPLNDGGTSSVNVTHAGLHDPVFIGERHYRLHPYPFGELPLTLEFPARHIHGKTFSSDADIQHRFATAEVQMMTVVMTK